MNAVYLDLETTGVDPAKDRIIQIAIVPEQGEPWEFLVNPGRPIPLEVQELTGITDAMVAIAPPFTAIAEEVIRRLNVPTIIGFSCNGFDIPCLAEEFERAGLRFDFRTKNIIDVGTIFKIREPRNLTEAVRVYCGREHEGAHGAMADAAATRDVFQAQRSKYSDLPKTPVELDKFTRYDRQLADPAGKLAYDSQGRLVYNTFRNRGVAVEEDPGYGEWMLRTDFPLATLRVLREEFDRIATARQHPVQDDELPWDDDGDSEGLFDESHNDWESGVSR